MTDLHGYPAKHGAWIMCAVAFGLVVATTFALWVIAR